MIDRYKALLFDFDFTLADSSRGVTECINYALAKVGYGEIAPELIRPTIGFHLKQIFSQLTSSTSAPEVQQFIDHFTEHANRVMTDATFIYPEVPKALEAFKHQGLLLGIVSTKFRYRIEEVLALNGLTDYFQVIIGGEDVENHKPHPEGLYLAIHRLGISPGELLYIGDSIVDAELTRNAEVAFAAVLTGATPRETFEPFKPVSILDTLAQLC